MELTRLAATSLAACATIIHIGCKDIPLLPKWNADEQLPLASRKITVSPPFAAGVPIPNGTSQNVSFAADSQTIDGLVGQILSPGLVAGTIVSVVTKSVTINGTDTLFIAATLTDLTNALAQRIVVPLTIVAANTKDSAQAPITAGGLTMLQNVAIANGKLYIQMRGQATCANPGGPSCTFVAGDSVGVKLTLLATVPISR
jgi:hypothetical protein